MGALAGRALISLLLVLVLVLQYRLWVGQGSLAEVSALKRDMSEQKMDIERLKSRNQALRAEVDGLKRGLDAVEALARSELGMIRDGETFYQIPPPSRQ
jgi:cell division protein FtsB